MQQKKKYFFYIKLLIIILLFILLSIIFFIPKKEVELIRIKLERPRNQSKINLKIKNNHLQETQDGLLLNLNDYLITLKGIFMLKENPADKERITSINPGLKGKYMMDFHIFNAPFKSKISYVNIFQKRNMKVLKKIKINKTESLRHYQIPLFLNKFDMIEFHVKKDSISAISNPIFYKIEKNKKKEFVFIIVADTLRWDHIGAYNHSKNCSPNIDLFSKDAVIFKHAYSTSPWTLPAHISLFTALNPNNHQINYGNERLSNHINVLFEGLQEKFINYSFNDDTFVSGLYGFSRGFDIYKEANYSKWYFYNQINNSDLLKNGAKRMFANAREYVEKVQNKYSLFFLHTYQIHNPYAPEIELAKAYYKDSFNKFEFSPIRFIEKGKSLFKKVTDSKRKEIERIYDAGVYTFDYRFGEFIRFLKVKNHYHHSTIILLSDHGEEFNDHGAWEHGHSLYNELIRIPLIIKFPKNKYAGRRVNTFVSICDILPTILELYNISHSSPKKLDGVSLFKSFKKNNKSKGRIIAYLAPYSLRDHIPEKIALFSENFKFIFNKPMAVNDLKYFKTPPPSIENELYNIYEDPYEKRNIIRRYQHLAAKMLNKIKRMKFKKGKKGFLKDLEENLKTLGYIN